MNTLQPNSLAQAAVPVGTVITYAGSISGSPSMPTSNAAGTSPVENPQIVDELAICGWLPCDGRSLQIDQYRFLYAVIGMTYGGSVTTQTFNLPDLRSLCVPGANGNGGGNADTTSGDETPPANIHFNYLIRYC